MVAFQLSQAYLPSLLLALVRTPRTGIPLPDVVNVDNDYDYVIVGSGWGGSVLANRLSEDPRTKVLLLEAGAKDNVSTEIPLFALSHHGAGYDWQYKTTPQKQICANHPGMRCPLPAGKVAGGSSTIGEVIYVRGNKEDLDNLGKIVPGWNYSQVLPFYKKWEDFHDQNNQCAQDPEHGCGGEVHVGPLPPGTRGDTTEYFIEGAKEIFGLEESVDTINSPGIETGHFFMKKGVRVNAATAFLKPIAHQRKNLHISLNSFVNKVLIDPATKKAIGVEFEKDGVIRQVKSNKEVLLSAGVYQSPKILMLSGIGPKAQLEKFNIPVIVNLPGVGENYKDFVFSSIPLTSGRNVPKEKQFIFTSSVVNQWTRGKGGTLAKPSGLDAGFTFRSSLAENNSTGPDLSFVYQSIELYSVFAFYVHRSLGYSDELWTKIFEPEIDKEYVNIQVSIKDPKSKGTIQLQSSDPKDYPIIEPNAFGDVEDHDLKTLTEGLRAALKFEHGSLFKKHGYALPKQNFDECPPIAEGISDDVIKCYLKTFTLPRWCGCCSNKMGPKSDEMAVVDERLRVHGISGLRVVDASILPSHLRAPPAATVIMIGEKAAHMIKEDNK